MQEHDLSFSPEELAIIRSVSDEAAVERAHGDPDAQPMSDDMLAEVQPGRRITRGQDARSSAGKLLQKEARTNGGQARP